MKITRLSLLLLIVALLTVMLTGTQQSVVSASAPVARAYRPISVALTAEPENLFTGWLAGDTVFPNNQRSQPLGNITGGEVDDETLRLYFDLSALSIKKRRSAFRNATPDQKSSLWKVHLALFLVKRPDLNEWQKAVILSAVDMATPEYFGTRSNDPAWQAKVQEPSRLLEQQIFNAFSREDAAKIFATLGDEAEATKSSASLFLKNIHHIPLSDFGPYRQVSLSRFVADDFELEQASCECSTSSDYCSIWSVCRRGSCALTADGCGTFWTYPCNGACR